MTRGRVVAVSAIAAVFLDGRKATAQDAPPDVAIPDFEASMAEPGGDDAAVETVPIDELLRTSVYAVTRKPQLVRESPGVVTILTREEILASGARDLVDVLMLVPGFGFAADVQGVVGVGFRGQWAAEGKALLLVDGQEMNELFYAGVQWGNHYPLEAIERIEIIRGPGSAIYGGFAELTVINVVTRRGDRLGGVAAAGRYGHYTGAAGGLGHANVSVEGGDQRGDLILSIATVLGRGQRSDRTYEDVHGEAYSLDGSSDLDPTHVSLGLELRGLRARLMYDKLDTRTRDGFGENASIARELDFTSFVTDLQYDLRVRDDLVITPRAQHRRQTPWHDPDMASEFFYDKTVDRVLAGVLASWDPRANVNVLGGVEGFYDAARLNSTELVGLQTQFGDANEVAYRNVAGYSQVSLNHAIANVTVGARVEDHSQFGTSFVPRLGITKVAGRFHVKVLAARAFRAPAIENINTNPDLVPERTTVFEVETGYQLSDHAFVNANLFDQTIDDAIVYTVVDEQEAYFNFDRTGSRGGELEFRVRYPRGHLYASGAYYHAAGKNRVDLYTVPDERGPLLGLPQLKFTAHGALRVGRGLSIGPSVVVMSERYSFEGDEAGGTMLVRHAPTALVNAFASYADLGIDGLEIGAGVYNLLDSDYAYHQPYDGGHPSIPAPSREFIARVAYHVPF